NYGSEFSDSASEAEIQRKNVEKQKKDELYKKPNSKRRSAKPSKRTVSDLVDVEEGKRMRYHGILAMDAYQRHKKFVNDYLLLYGGKRSDFVRDTSKDKTDSDIIKENHRFLWDEEQDGRKSWEEKLAKKYWDKLYKEYTICDLTRYKENKIALRWRIEKEVISGKGQFICANKHCDESEGLRSWEVNFKYVESNEAKNTLVKSRLCPECSYKLNYHHKKRDVTAKPKKHKKTKDKKKKKEKQEDTIEPTGFWPNSICKNKYSKTNPSTSTSEHIWKKPIVVEETKSREEEFDEYFEGMFL
uniref:FRA10A associated CGG repeat 1 n=1 Tax=Ciona savignyi TaxID=51511 RepID=H2YZY2_CIOSA